MASGSHARAHCAAFLSENADRRVHRAPHSIEAPPLAVLGGAGEVIVRRLTATLSIAGSSFDVWAALARLDLLLSDYRRIAPRFSFGQLTGQPGISAGNEYRHRTTDSAVIARLEEACRHLTGEDPGQALGGTRSMDLRILRAGPWGGETAEMVMETLRNHAVAGAASVWVLVHGEGADGRLPVRLDICEVARWAWAPDRLAAARGPEGVAGGGVAAWPYFLERLAQALDAVPVTNTPDASFAAVLAPEDLTTDSKLREALRIHSALASYIGRVSGN